MHLNVIKILKFYIFYFMLIHIYVNSSYFVVLYFYNVNLNLTQLIY
jgi:hypothetical protein